MTLSGRHLAKLIGISPRQLRRLQGDGLVTRPFTLEKSIAQLVKVYRDRLTLAEQLCRTWCPGELDARLADRHERGDP